MTLTISYQTQHLPPPQAYAAVMEIDVTNEIIEANLSIEYINRDSLTLDEIIAEGYTKDDNYQWKGTLSSAWSDDIFELASLNQGKEPHSEIYLHLSKEQNQGGFPKDIKKADHIFHEILQAILETDSIEKPLTLKMKLNEEIETFHWKFSTREFIRNDRQFNDWSLGRKFMNLVFSLNFEQLKPIKKPQNGTVEIEGLWYPLPKKIIESTLKILGDH
ncbi:MAG: hypothetical protein HRT61_06130 [Ekhidna sp.]|nr:hypothetical protein [Ekhidna sp.]